MARASAQQAPLVMLDEVSMGLAPIIVDEIFEFLGRLAA
jgi:branched-chain amino acid transport system ATP-binding protein